MPAKTRDPLDHAVALHAEAQRLFDQGEPARARRVCVQALAQFERFCDPRHPDIANVLIELASIDRTLGDYTRAIASAKRALSILRGLRGEGERRLRFQGLDNLAHLEVARGKYTAAAVHGRRALVVARGLTKGELANALNGLGVIYKFLSRYDDAAKLYRRALAMARRASPSNPIQISTLLHNLAGLEHSRGRFARGVPLARRSVEISSKVLGRDHPTVAADIANLAALVDGHGGHREAQKLYREAIRIFEGAFGKEHFEVAFNLGQLAASHHVAGNLGEAKRLYVRALRLQKKIMGPRHPFFLATKSNAAQLEQKARE